MKASDVIARGNPGVVLAGRLYLGPVVQPTGAPIVDDGSVRSVLFDGTEVWYHGVVVTLRNRPTPSRGWVIAARGWRPLATKLWRFPRFLTRVRS